MAKSKITRRTVLRGMLGGTAVSFGLPPLEAMFDANGTAYAQGAPLPKRLGIFFFGDGVKHDRWNPTETGPGWTPSIELAPLMPVKDYISIITGMAIKTGPSQGHHLGATGILSGAPLVSQPPNGAPFRSTFAQPSFDQIAADSIGLTTKLKSLEIGVSQRVNGNEGTSLKYLSHRGPDLYNPPEYDPGLVFDRLFGIGYRRSDVAMEDIRSQSRPIKYVGLFHAKTTRRANQQKPVNPSCGKNSSFRVGQISSIDSPVSPGKRGGSRVVTDAGWDAVDAAASARKACSQGGLP